MAASPLETEVRFRDGLAAVELRGDIDRDADDALATVYAQAGDADARVILLDFARVGYINSTGIALIVRLLAEARRDGREVRASGLTPHYTEIFTITRLSDYMRIFDDAASAAKDVVEAGTATTGQAVATGGQP